MTISYLVVFGKKAFKEKTPYKLISKFTYDK